MMALCSKRVRGKRRNWKKTLNGLFQKETVIYTYSGCGKGVTTLNHAYKYTNTKWKSKKENTEFSIKKKKRVSQPPGMKLLKYEMEKFTEKSVL